MTATNFGCQQLDVPYERGRNRAELTDYRMTKLGSRSGLTFGATRAAYAATAVTTPRMAQTQYDAGPRVPARGPMLPGDLVFSVTRRARLRMRGSRSRVRT